MIFTLLLISNINYCLGDYPSYVGVREGDEYIWDVTMSETVANEFIDDYEAYYYSLMGTNPYETEMAGAEEKTEGLHKGITLTNNTEKWFKINVTTTMNLTVTVNWTSIQIQLNYAIVNYKGQNLDGGGLGGSFNDFTSSVFAEVTDFIYIRLEQTLNSTLQVDLQLNITTWNLYPSSTEVTPGSYPGNSINNGETHIYNITVTSGKNLTLYVDTTVDNLGIAIVDRDGDQFIWWEYTDGVNNDTQVTEYTLYNGTYFLMVYLSSGGPVNYDMVVSLGAYTTPLPSEQFDIFRQALEEYKTIKGIKVVIEDVKPEQIHPFYEYKYTPIQLNVYFSNDMVTWTNGSQEFIDYFEGLGLGPMPTSYIILNLMEPSYLNASTFYQYQMAIFMVPLGINWVNVATYLQAYIPSLPATTTATVTALSNGLTGSYYDSAYTFEKFEGTITFSGSGVLEKVEISYGGNFVGSLILQGFLH
jgi:hypothetical protein